LGKKGGGSTTTTNVTKYPEPTKQELAMQDLQLKYAQMTAPNALKLNEMGSNMLFSNPGVVPVDYTQFAKEGVEGAKDLQKQATNLANGVLPQSYLDNMNKAMKSGVDQSVGSALNGLAGRGVLNSSVTSGAMSNIGKNAQNVMAQNFQNAITQQSGLLEQRRGLLTSPMEIANAAQNASIDIPMKLYAASTGQQAPTTDTWRTISGQRYATPTTTTTQSMSGGGDGGFLGGLLSGAGAYFCFVAGTKIATPYGAINIEDIKEGDTVYTLGMEDNIIEEKVTFVAEPAISDDVYLTIVTDKGSVTTTASQPFLSENGFIRADNINIGDKLVVIWNNVAIVEKIVTLTEKELVYDLSVAGKNIYFADGFAVEGR
jgi:hypothetical protein